MISACARPTVPALYPPLTNEPRIAAARYDQGRAATSGRTRGAGRGAGCMAWLAGICNSTGRGLDLDWTEVSHDFQSVRCRCSVRRSGALVTGEPDRIDLIGREKGRKVGPER